MINPGTDDLGGPLARKTAFAYRCRACSRCCWNKTIQVNPYELAQLTLALDCNLETLITYHTVGGNRLRQSTDGRCVFLGEEGCTVHAHRPLVCRLYPLGRIVNTDRERFVELQPHPRSAGLYGRDGMVDDYLGSQEAEAYMVAADVYFRLYLDLAESSQLQNQNVHVHEQDLSAMLLDLQGTVVETCADSGAPVPRSLEEMVPFHGEAIRSRLLNAGHNIP